MNAEWDGRERRSIEDGTALSKARAELAYVRRSTDQLAQAVVEMSDTALAKRTLAVIGGMLATLFVLLVVFSLFEMNRLNDRLDAGHDKIACLLLIQPQDRTAQNLVECSKG